MAVPEKEGRRLFQLFTEAGDGAERVLKRENFQTVTEKLAKKGDGNAEADDQGDDGNRRQMVTTLVVNDVAGEAILNHPVRSKGLIDDAWVASQLLEDLETLGLNGSMLAVKCDQGSAVAEVQREIVQRHELLGGRRTLVEYSKLGDSDSNSRIERVVGVVCRNGQDTSRSS